MSRLNDPAVVAREYESDQRLRDRRLDVWGDVEGGDPEVVALEALADSRPTRVLDAGCGPGLFARRIRAPEVVGLDSSLFMVERARAAGVDARLGEIEMAPFADDEFDAVACNWVLYHLCDLDHGLAELARVLRPGGRLVAIANSERHLEELWRELGRGGEARTFSAENGAAALKSHFSRVERLDVDGSVTWPSRNALEGYIAALQGLTGELTVPELKFPLRATRRNCVFVADR